MANVDCIGGNCEKCGWNPAVSKKRKKEIRSVNNDFLNLGKRLRNYKSNVVETCYAVLAEKIGDKVTGEDLQLISMGVSTRLLADDLKKIDKALSRIEVEKDGGQQVS